MNDDYAAPYGHASVPEREENAHVADADRPGFFDAIRQASAEGAKQGMTDGLPGLKQELTDFGRETMIGVAVGKGFPLAVPDVTAVTAKGKEIVVVSDKGDAKNRAFRTFFQGLALDIGFALLTVLVTLFTTIDFSSKEALLGAVILLVKTVAQTTASYVMRLKFSPNYEKPPVKVIEGENAA